MRSFIVAIGLLGCAGRSAQPLPVSHREPAAKPAAPSEPPELIDVAGATFMMGGDYVKPHRETVADFELQRTEVTTATYRKCVSEGACSVPGGVSASVMKDWSATCKTEMAHECNFDRSDREDHPINCVTFNQAEAYCQWRGWRLPTEQEWELAARGTEGRKFPWGDAAWTPDRANLCDERCSRELHCPFPTQSSPSGDGYRTTSPVGSFPAGATPSGIEDMLGNVWEWTSTSAMLRPSPAARLLRTVRGAGWNFFAAAQYADESPIESAAPDLGFRCARDAHTDLK